MHCVRHPLETLVGVCASCLRERLYGLLEQEEGERFRFRYPEPLISPPALFSGEQNGDQTQGSDVLDDDRLRRSLEFIEGKPVRRKFSLLSRFKDDSRSKNKCSHTDKVHVDSQLWKVLAGCSPARHAAVDSGPDSHGKNWKNENVQEPRRLRSTAGWVSIFLPQRRGKKSMPADSMPKQTKTNAKTNDLIESLASARSSFDKRCADEPDFLDRSFDLGANQGRDCVEDYYSDSDLRKVGGAGISVRRGLQDSTEKKNSRVAKCPQRGGFRTGNNLDEASSSAPRRIDCSVDQEGRDISPCINRRLFSRNAYIADAFSSPSPKMGRKDVQPRNSNYNHTDSAGSFSPYTARKVQSPKRFFLARRESSGFSFCLSPRKLFTPLFEDESPRTPSQRGRHSNFFSSPLRRKS